jgi:hypothetical protein
MSRFHGPSIVDEAKPHVNILPYPQLCLVGLLWLASSGEKVCAHSEKNAAPEDAGCRELY